MQVGQDAGPCKIRRAYCSFETSTTGRRLSHAGGAVSGLAMSSAVALVLPRLSLATHVERPCVFLILSSRMQNHHLLCFRSVFFHGTFLHMRLSQACVAAIVVLDRLCSRPDRVLSSCLLAMHKKLCIIFLLCLALDSGQEASSSSCYLQKFLGCREVLTSGIPASPQVCPDVKSPSLRF